MFASAAFTDQADIKATDAVNMLSSLGVITGYTDGSYQPNKVVTRAEMAKMIFVVRNNKIDDSAYQSNYSKLTDISNHWAKGYIKFCESQGIIAGKGNNKFDPDSPVTGVEAAKMLLVVAGYDTDKAGLTGSAWRTNTLKYAGAAGILDDVNAALEQGLPRQYAAQMIYNTLDTNRVKWSKDSESFDDVLNGGVKETVGHAYMGLTKTTGTLVSISKDALTVDNVIAADSDAVDRTGNYETAFTKVSEDYSSLLGQRVKVLFKDGKTNSVLGVYPTSDNTVYNTIMNGVEQDGKKIKFDGKSYSIEDKGVKVYVDGALQLKADKKTVDLKSAADFDDAYTNATTGAALISGRLNRTSADEVIFVDSDDSSKINILKVTTYSVEKVTYVGTDYINAGGARKNDHYNYPSVIKKDDYVVISKAGNYADDKGLITKAETVEGKVTGTKGSDKVLINDTWYTADYKAGTTTVIDNWPSSNATVKLVLVNGFVQFVDTVTAGTADMVMVIETGSASGLGGNKVADVMFADGSRKTVELDSASEYGYNNTPVVLGTPKLATYEVSKGKYTLKAVSGTARNGYDIYATAASQDVDGNIKGNVTLAGQQTGSNNKLFFKSDAVVFVKYKTDDYKVVTGKDVANWSKTTLKSVEALGELTSGNAYAQVAVVTMDTKLPGASNSNYAYALDDPYEQTIDGTKYTFIKAWDGTKEVTFKSEDTKTGITKRTAFEYSNNSDGTVDLTRLDNKKTTGANGEYYALTKITSYDEGTGAITFEDSNCDLSTKNKIKAGETTILYVNSDDKVGVGAFDIEVAEDVNADGRKEDNVIVYSEKGDDYINLIVVDVNNYMHS